MTRVRELTQPTTKVIREGEEQEIPTPDVVVGDLIILSSGVRIAADARLIESGGLLVNEASLTGESLPMRKEAWAEVTEKTNIAEKHQYGYVNSSNNQCLPYFTVYKDDITNSG